MIVVSDTSPLNYLVLIRQIEIIPKLYGEVIVPGAVLEEMLDPQTPIPVLTWANSLPAWTKVRDPLSIDPSLRVDRGESAAISLAIEMNADLLLVDDRAGVTAANSRGLKTIGTLGVIIRAAHAGLLDGNRAFDALLAQTTFRASQILIDSLRKQLP